MLAFFGRIIIKVADNNDMHRRLKMCDYGHILLTFVSLGPGQLLSYLKTQTLFATFLACANDNYTCVLCTVEKWGSTNWI